MRVVAEIRPSNKRWDHLVQLVERTAPDFLDFRQIAAVQLMDQLLVESAVSEHPHIGQRSGRKKTAKAVEHFRPQRSGIGGFRRVRIMRHLLFQLRSQGRDHLAVGFK